jgi:hypothetical protein
MDIVPNLDGKRRGRPPGSAKRFKLGDPDIPYFVGYSVVMDLLRQLFNWAPRYDDWRELVENGAFPSFPHPGGLKVQDVRVRVYHWPDVEAYYRAVMKPIAPRKIS